MSRYIDADKVLKELHLNHKDVIYIDKNECAKRIENVPSIDIVRCGECEHWKQAPNTDKGWCDRLDGLLEPPWYCADGERREP